MDKDALHALVNDPRFIPGIHRYCDRWCARCAFTARCLSYALREQTAASLPDALDAELQASLDLLSQDPVEAVDAEAGRAQERHEELPEAPPEASPGAPASHPAAAHRAHPLVQAAESYESRVASWFGAAPPRPGQGALAEAAEILEEAATVVRWDQHCIFVSLVHALGSRTAGRADEGRGVAKVALLSIDRSIEAWRRFLRHLPARQAATLPLLVHLERLREQVEAAFPGARAFVRPGFDEV